MADSADDMDASSAYGLLPALRWLGWEASSRVPLAKLCSLSSAKRLSRMNDESLVLLCLLPSPEKLVASRSDRDRDELPRLLDEYSS